MHLETHLSTLNNKAHVFMKSGTRSRVRTTQEKAHRRGSQALAHAQRQLDGEQTPAKLPEPAGHRVPTQTSSTAAARGACPEHLPTLSRAMPHRYG